MVVLKSERIIKLMKMIWTQRETIKVDDLQKTQEFKDLQNEYPKFKDLLAEAIKDMIFDVKEIDQHKNYVVKEDKICYLVDDEYSFKKTEGYLTAFSYIKEQE
jgi:hypothetical protein